MALATEELAPGPVSLGARQARGSVGGPGSGAVGAVALASAAVFSLGAAAIHFGFAPAHFDERWAHGMFFVALGAVQIGWAVWALVRPSRAAAWAGLLQLLVVGVWIASRTVGLPTVDVEPVAFPDSLASMFELLGALFCAVALARRALRPWSVALLGLAVAGTTMYSLTPGFADAHQHGSVAAGAAGAVGHGHVGGPGAAGAAGLGVSGATPCERAGAPSSPELADIDSEGHSHRGPSPQQAIDAGTREALAGQQATARAAAAKYPTVADAQRAGYRMSTPYVPCIGAHYTNIAFVVGFDPARPSELLFDGTRPDSKLVGLSYLVYNPGGAPAGFAGPNDLWHQHNANGGLCFNRSGVVIAGESASVEQCARLGGAKQPLTDVWMLHDWVVPGWECGWGVFAPECPELGGRVGASAWD